MKQTKTWKENNVKNQSWNIIFFLSLAFNEQYNYPYIITSLFNIIIYITFIYGSTKNIYNVFVTMHIPTCNDLTISLKPIHQNIFTNPFHPVHPPLQLPRPYIWQTSCCFRVCLSGVDRNYIDYILVAESLEVKEKWVKLLKSLIGETHEEIYVMWAVFYTIFIFINREYYFELWRQMILLYWCIVSYNW